MPNSIFVVEYEPRYIERVRQALSGYSQPTFAKDGEEALRTLQASAPGLIILSSIIPKISTSELIRKIRGMAHLQSTPILITVSGYNGKSPKADAVKLGASDILPKPYSEGEFLNKVRQLLEPPAMPEPTVAVPKMAPPNAEPEPTVVVPKISPDDVQSTVRSSVDDALSGLVEDASKRPAARQSKSSAELDKLLETTLSGLQTGPRKPAAAPRPEPKMGSSEQLDKLLETTLSGLDVPRRSTVEKPVPPAQAAPQAPVAAQPVAAPSSPVVPEHTEQMKMPTAEELEAERKRDEEERTRAEEERNRAENARRRAEEEARIAAAPSPPPPPPLIPEGSVSVASPLVAEPAGAREETKDEAGDDEGIRFGPYVLLEKIATGGMAEVWKARMRGVEGFQKIVAIKKILPHMSDNEEFLTMFVDEAKLAAQLSHNNIIHIYELGKIDESYFIAMEYVDGEDLKSIIRRGRETGQPMSVELALFVASKIASALDYAHRKRGFDDKELGLVHRDVSPQNVLISHEGDIKLCDFGIAKAASKASHTMAGALKGKLQYMSPEQAWGRSIDRRSDVFALAAVLFEMLTSQKLFSGDSELSVLEQVREARVRAPSSVNDEIPAEVDTIVLKALAVEPEQRYQTAGEMGRDLEQILYSYRPTPTSADLAIHMDRLFVAAPSGAPAASIPEEMPQVTEPEAEPEAFAAEPVALVPPAPPEPAPAPEPMRIVREPEPVPAPVAAEGRGHAEVEEEKKFPVVPVAIAAVVLIAAIGGGAFLMSGKKSGSTAETAQASPPPVSAPVSPSTETDDPATDDASTGLVDPEAPATDTAADQALIDQEVQKRIEAERQRLDAQRQLELRRAEEAAGTQQAPVTERPAPQEQAPPAQATPAPAAAEQQAPPPVATPTPTPQPPVQQPAAQAVKEGDFVAVGTPGLVAPSLVNFSKPVYPHLAKRQRVQGVVVVQALISEKGEVLDVKVLRGVKEDVGINEAAISAIKKSTFSPATKDGVKVRSYYMGTIPFQL
jgi:TonB family protein